MGDWRALLSVPRFRALWLALVCANLGSWGLMAALPILVAERFGAGSALVLSLTWRILAKVLLAPVSGLLLRRFGPPRVVCAALAAESASQPPGSTTPVCVPDSPPSNGIRIPGWSRMPRPAVMPRSFTAAWI